MKTKKAWSSLRDSGRLRNLGLFAIFVLVAAALWCILTLNEQAQTDVQVRVAIVDVPDSVTIISEPPGIIHISVRDRGSRLLRLRFSHPQLRLSFKEFAADGVLRVPSRAILAQLRSLCGQGATISVLSNDSIVAPYTTVPGKMVPVRVVFDIIPELGKVVSGAPRSSVRMVKVFALRDVIDTISYVPTEPIVRRGVADTFKVTVALRPGKGVRVEPSSVEVTIPVEPLENRKITVPVSQVNVPAGEALALFPDKVEVNYLVPMNQAPLPASAFRVQADYRSITDPAARSMPVSIARVPKGVTNPTLASDSVEFTIIRHAR